MIIVKGRELLIPENERYIGTNYDAGMENRLFRISRYSQSGTDLSYLTFKINLIFEGDPLDRAEMTKAVDDDYIYLTWTVTEAQVAVTGTIFVCVTGNDTNDTVKWSSFQAPFYTEKSLGDDIDTAYRELVNRLDQEIADRGAAVTAEADARQAADTTLQQNIDAEAAARAEADVVLQANIDSEVLSRSNADTVLQNAVSEETSTRAGADTALNARIDNLIVGAGGSDITEVVDARIGFDGSSYGSLKTRIDTEVGALRNAEFLALKGTYSTTIPNGTDYNSLLTPGNYNVLSTANAQTMVNCPVTVMHRMFVVGIPSSTNRVCQIIFNGNVTENMYIFVRFFGETSWSAWRTVAYADQVAEAMNLVATSATWISNNTDYDTLKTPGNYRCNTVANAQTMVNCPVQYGHRLTIIELTVNRYLQIVQSSQENTLTFVRYFTGTAWSSWRRLSFYDEVEGTVSFDQSRLALIPNGTDYDTITDVGAYEVRNSKNAASMRHCPANRGHRLYVTRLYTGSTFVFQTVITGNDKLTQYVRNRNKMGYWSAWTSTETQAEAKFTPLYNEFNNLLSLNISRIKRGGIAVYSTLPYEDSVKGSNNYYDQDQSISGVLYSSVWRDGLDVFRNLTLETFYSALENPASVLYTKTYVDKNISNAHSWYGGVCSTYVTKMMNFRQYKTTNQLEDYIKPKPITDVRDIAVGDMLLRTGHIAFISQLYIDSDGALSGIGISEEGQPIFMTSIVKVEDFEDYLTAKGYTVMIPKQEISAYGEMDDPQFNHEIIFERGNNTYVTADDISDGAWFYIPNAETIYWKKDDGEFATLSVASLPSKTVNEATVYNLASCFNGIGDYYFTDNTDTYKKCLIKMISTGTITLSGNTLTLSGWENCIPYNYYIVREIARTSEDQNYAMDPSEGYYCAYTNQCGDIDVITGETSKIVTIPAGDIATYNRYKIWVEFDTGIGYKQAFSNLVVV